MRLLVLLLLCVLNQSGASQWSSLLSVPEWDRPVFPLAIQNGDIEIIDHAANETGYHLIRSLEYPVDGKSVVVFLHGYGALNPMIYGTWLKHLAMQGHAVVYPRYQKSIFSPPPSEFVSNTVIGIQKALDELAQLGYPVESMRLNLIGHSYGGVIAANIAARYGQYGLPKPSVALVCQPGTGPFKGGILESYAEMDPELRLAILVGADDGTVGEKFGRHLFDVTTSVNERIFLRQFEDRHDEARISASHYEPYSIYQDFDNGHRNFTAKKALRLSALNLVDLGYWKVFDLMFWTGLLDLDLSIEDQKRILSSLGNWQDGVPVKRMEVRVLEKTEGTR